MADGIATLISALGLTQETFLVFCILAVLIVGAVVVIITSRPILDIYPYLNPSVKPTMLKRLKTISKVFLNMLTF